MGVSFTWFILLNIQSSASTTSSVFIFQSAENYFSHSACRCWHRERSVRGTWGPRPGQTPPCTDCTSSELFCRGMFPLESLQQITKMNLFLALCPTFIWFIRYKILIKLLQLLNDKTSQRQRREGKVGEFIDSSLIPSQENSCRLSQNCPRAV